MSSYLLVTISGEELSFTSLAEEDIMKNSMEKGIWKKEGFHHYFRRKKHCL